MISQPNYNLENQSTPTIFRPDFNQTQNINATQAWSLFFSIGQKDKALGKNPETGWFYNYALLATVVVGSLGAALFNSF